MFCGTSMPSALAVFFTSPYQQGWHADMAEHEPFIGATDDWYTAPDILDALGMIFALDPCSPSPAHIV
jgi:hypothetical protein